MAFTWIKTIATTFNQLSGTDVHLNIKDTVDEVQANVDLLHTNKSDVGHGHASTEVSYSNTTSGLVATDTQAAIDEVNGKIPSDAFNTIMGKIGVAQMITGTPVVITAGTNIKLTAFDAAPHSTVNIVTSDIGNDWFNAVVPGVYKISGVLAIETTNGTPVSFDLFAEDSTPTAVTPTVTVEGKGAGTPVMVGYNTVVNVDEANTKLYIRMTSAANVTINSSTVILEKTLYGETL